MGAGAEGQTSGEREKSSTKRCFLVLALKKKHGGK